MLTVMPPKASLLSAVALPLALLIGCGKVSPRSGTLAPDLGEGGETVQSPTEGAAGSAAGGRASSPGGSGSSMPGAEGGAAGSKPVDMPPLGGNPSDVAEPLKSSGCGKALPPEQVPTLPGARTGYTEWHVQQTGATLGTPEPSKAGDRQFFVRVPADYDRDKPYRVVYVGSGCGAQHAGKTNTYPLFLEAEGGNEQAVYVGLSVPDSDANPGCYDISSGPQSQEWEAFDLIHALVEATYCVDNHRIYVAGYSTGGWVANMWGCYFGGIPSSPRLFSPKWAVRGHAAVAASLPPNQPMPCGGSSAGFWIHDTDDTAVRLATEVAALNLTLQTNGCTGNYEDGPKQPWPPAESIPGLAGGICQEYTGCPADVAESYPLIFCTTNGFGHGDQAASAIPAINLFFDLMDQQ